MRKAAVRFALCFFLALWPLYNADAALAQAQTQTDQILEELRQMRRLLEELVKNSRGQGQNPPANSKIELGTAPILGEKSAPVTIVEFTDYQCPFCQRFHLSTFPLLKRDYIDSGKVRFVSRDFPLTQIHRHAFRAALAARCASEQGKFWEFRDQLQRSGEALELSNLLDYAGGLSLNVPSFKSCVESEKYKNAIENDMVQATGIGVNATPSFLVGKSTPAGVDGELISGAVPYEIFSARLKALLGEAGVR
jgi:protein-disulfide isomerase